MAFETQKHHIIPACYYKINKMQINSKKDNLVNLKYSQHILAHYYLAMCSTGELRYNNLIAIHYILGNAKKNCKEQISIEDLNLDKIDELYRKSKLEFGNKLRGTTHEVSESTRKKISEKNSGRIYIHKNGKNKFIRPEELDNYLINGWALGRREPNHGGIKKGKTKILHKGEIEKFVKIEDVDRFIADGWEHGICDTHKQKTKNGVIKMFNEMSLEERKQIYGAHNIGTTHTVSDETRKKLSIANKGRKQSEKQKKQNSLNKRGCIHITNGVEDKMLKPEEANEFLQQGWYRGRSKNRRKD